MHKQNPFKDMDYKPPGTATREVKGHKDNYIHDSGKDNNPKNVCPEVNIKDVPEEHIQGFGKHAGNSKDNYVKADQSHRFNPLKK